MACVNKLFNYTNKLDYRYCLLIDAFDCSFILGAIQVLCIYNNI